MGLYPLAIKWVVGQIAVGKDINTVLAALTSPSGDVARFCFERIFTDFLGADCRLVLYALAASEGPLTMGILSHVSGLPSERLEDALQELTRASLVNSFAEYVDSQLETRYDLLQLTRNYVSAQLRSEPEIDSAVKGKVLQVKQFEDAKEHVERTQEWSLAKMKAKSTEDKLAATTAIAAHQKFGSGDYEGATSDFMHAAEIAPSYATLFRSWAEMESLAEFHDRADELMRQATDLDPNDPMLWMFWGNLDKKRGRLITAAKYLGTALRLAPDNPLILGAYGEIEKRRGRFEEAERLLLAAIEHGAATRSSLRHEVVARTSLADNYDRWAMDPQNSKDPATVLTIMKKALDHAKKASTLAPEDFHAACTYREICLRIGSKMLANGRLGTAADYFLRAVVKAGHRYKEKRVTSRACINLVKIFTLLGESSKAQESYATGLQALVDGDFMKKQYDEAGVEFTSKRKHGHLTKIIGEGHSGIIVPNGEIGETVLILRRDMWPISPSVESFVSLVGKEISYIEGVGSEGKPLAVLPFAKLEPNCAF